MVYSLSTNGVLAEYADDFETHRWFCDDLLLAVDLGDSGLQWLHCAATAACQQHDVTQRLQTASHSSDHSERRSILVIHRRIRYSVMVTLFFYFEKW